MFWDTGYSNSATIDALLNNDSCTLKELLNEEDILQECKSQNQKLVKFLNRTEIVDELVTLISTEPSTDIAEENRFLYPNVACEIITSDVPSLKQRLVEDSNIMNKLYGFFEREPPLNPLLASFICKTFSTLIIKKMETDWFLYQTICLHVLEFIKSKDNFLDSILQHFATPVVVDLLLNMLNDVEDEKMKANFLEWINEKGLIAKLIDVLKVPGESDRHESIAQFLTKVVETGRCNRQNDTEDRKSLPNPLLQTLEDRKTVEQLLDVILDESKAECGIMSGIQVLLCLLENPIIQEPVSQSALQQMIDAEKEHHDEIVSSLMVIVQPRVQKLFELLLNPPTKINLSGATPLTAPLGNVRLQLCYLFTVLVETENTSIIEEICKTDFFAELLKLFKQYCWNNFLHNYVKKCLVYGIQAFDTIPNSTQLVISALQKHIVVDCKVADKLIDCWSENHRSQQNNGRRMGYMGHLIEILGAAQSTTSASDEFRALIESSLSSNIGGEGEPAPESTSVEEWRQILDAADEQQKLQSRLLADVDPSVQQDYGIGLATFQSSPNEYENDNEDFDFQYSSAMHDAVNGIGDFADDYTNDDDLDARNKMFEEACNQNLSTFSIDSNFANWNDADIVPANHDFPFDFNNLNLKPNSSPFENEDDQQQNNDDDAFASSANGFSSIMDNFADFDSHFAETTPSDLATDAQPIQAEVEPLTEPCFVATTQTIEISTAPAEPSVRDFILGRTIAPTVEFRAPVFEDDDEFFSLRDDSNDMSSLTDDFDKKMMENTEVPDDEDDDFASADESSSKGHSEEETNSNGGDQFADCNVSPPPDAKNDDLELNGTENMTSDGNSPPTSPAASEPSKLPQKAAQAPDSEPIPPAVPLENGSA